MDVMEVIFQQLLDVQFTWNFAYSFKVDDNTICKFRNFILSRTGFKGQKQSPLLLVFHMFTKTILKFNIKVSCRWYYYILVPFGFLQIYLNKHKFHGPMPRLPVSDFAIHSFICVDETNFSAISNESSLLKII